MKTKFILKLSSISLAIVILFASCASTTMISSKPAGAKIYIDGESVGTTPFKYTDTKIIGNVVDVELKKEGYKPFNTTFTRTEQVNAGAIVGGIFLVFPFLWTMDYKATHNYELIPIITTENTGLVEKTVINPKSKASRLTELKQLFDEKLITEEEYKTAKSKILNEK